MTDDTHGATSETGKTKNGTSKSRAKPVRERADAALAVIRQRAGQARETVTKVSKKVAAHIPADTVRGFSDARRAGHYAVAKSPYAAGAAIGFSFGVSEALVGMLALPARTLFNFGLSLGAEAAEE